MTYSSGAGTRTLQSRIVSGSVILLSGSSLTTVISLIYNIVVARFLGPKGFGHATAVYTVLTIISAVTLSFQIITAKAVAKQVSPEQQLAAYRGFHKGAWGCGIAVALTLFIFQRPIADYLNLPSQLLITIVAIGAVFYVPLGSRRGYIQGTYAFHRLATNLVVEGGVRLCGSVLLILLGMGVEGVILANTAAIAVAYFTVAPKSMLHVPNPLHFLHAIRETFQAMVFYTGQVLINNCDIVLVMHFFPEKQAGLYAAVAMVGRVIFSFSSAIVNSMFPIVAGTPDEERRNIRVIATSLLMVLGSGSVLSIALGLAPAWIWTTLFGSGFQIAGTFNLPYLLALYAFTTIIYSLSVVIITFEMSYKIANASWVQLVFSCFVVAGIFRYHSSLREVIVVQLALMLGLFVFVAIPFLVSYLKSSPYLLHDVGYQPIRLIRNVSENEVIAEFLKSDFHSPIFRPYQECMQDLVNTPNLHDPEENDKRRALLFLRHLALWKELPSDTSWYEVEMEEFNLTQIKIFPRAQWRKLARGNYSIAGVTEALRMHHHLLDSLFKSKIDNIRDRLNLKDPGFNAVILIGMNDHDRLTVLDGNHRMVAAMLASPSKLTGLRFLCGLSPHMKECCWYSTNFLTLLRYGRNMLANTVRNPEAELDHLLQDTG